MYSTSQCKEQGFKHWTLLFWPFIILGGVGAGGGGWKAFGMLQEV